MKISVIIPTYNGINKICNLLDSLKIQSFTDFEIIVSIDGSTDGTFEYLKTLIKDFERLIVLNNTNAGRSVCRNRGAVASNGNLLIFLDDDMRASPNLIEKHKMKHLQYPNSIIVGGQMEELNKCKSDIQKYKAYLSRKWSVISDEKSKVPYITAANFSISKELFLKLGAFDERLTDAEDYHLAILAFENNIPIYFNPEITAWHDDLITCKSYIKRLKEYEQAQEKLIKLFGDLYTIKYPFRNKIKISLLKKSIYYLFSFDFWVPLIDFGFLSVLPQSIKYRIYDLVIMGNVNCK